MSQGMSMSELTDLSKKLKKHISKDIEVSETLGAVRLEGEAKSWSEVIAAGKAAAACSYRGVVNDISVDGIDHKKLRNSKIEDNKLDGYRTDILIIGGGIIGCSIARELTRYDAKILLIDKESDIALHQSSRNDGMVHPGVMPKPGTKKAYYNVIGNQMFEKIAVDLNVPYRTIGTYVMFENKFFDLLGRVLLSRAQKNNVKGVRHVTRKQILEDEPNVTDSVVGGIYMPTTGVCPPYEMTIAMAESAVINGAYLSLNTQVLKINRERNAIKSVVTNRGKVFPKIVINAAGLFADSIAEMAQDRFFTIHPRKGQVALLDKGKGDLLNSVVSIVNLQSAFQNTKGGGLVKTADGNILAGPSALEQPFNEDYSTDVDEIQRVLNKNLRYIKGLDKSDVITYLAGNRAATYKEDFIVEASQYVDNLIYAAGIQSPGYASAPAIAKDICEIAVNKLRKTNKVSEKEHFMEKRKGIVITSQLDTGTRQALIEKNSDYGKIVCRCEEVSKGEILQAIHSVIPAVTVNAVKRRVRSGMGRCQGGFCRPLVAEIIQDETGLSLDSILSKGDIEL